MEPGTVENEDLEQQGATAVGGDEAVVHDDEAGAGAAQVSTDGEAEPTAHSDVASSGHSVWAPSSSTVEGVSGDDSRGSLLDGEKPTVPVNGAGRPRSRSTARKDSPAARAARYDMQRRSSGASGMAGKRPLSANAAASATRGAHEGDRRPLSAHSKLCDGCKKELDPADASLDIIEDEEDWEYEGQVKSEKDHLAAGRSTPASSHGAKPAGGSCGSAVLGDAYRHADAAQLLLTGLDTDSPKPAMSRVEAAARVAAVKDLLRSELDHLSQAVERLDSLREDELQLGPAQPAGLNLAEARLASRRGQPGPCPIDTNQSPGPVKYRGFTRSSQHGQARPASATAGGLEGCSRRELYGSDRRGAEWQREMSLYQRDLRRSAAVYGVQFRGERTGNEGIRSYGPDGGKWRAPSARPASAMSAREGERRMLRGHRAGVAPSQVVTDAAGGGTHVDCAPTAAHADGASGAHDGVQANGGLGGDAAGDGAASVAEEGEGNEVPSLSDPPDVQARDADGCETAKPLVGQAEPLQPLPERANAQDASGDRGGEGWEEKQQPEGKGAADGHASMDLRAATLEASIGGIGSLMVRAMDAKQRASLFMRHSELFQSRQDSFLDRLAVLAASCGGGAASSTPLSAAAFAARAQEEAPNGSEAEEGEAAQEQEIDAADIVARVEAGRTMPRAPGDIGRDALLQKLKNRKPINARPAFGTGAARPLAAYGRLSRDARVFIHVPQQDQHQVPPQIPPQAFGRPKSASSARGFTFSPLPTKGGKHRFAPMPCHTPLKPGQKPNIYALPQSHRFDHPPPRSPKKSLKMSSHASSGRASAGAEGSVIGGSAHGEAVTPQGLGRRRIAPPAERDALFKELIPRPQQWRVIDSPMASAPHSPLRPHSAGPAQQQKQKQMAIQRPHSALGGGRWHSSTGVSVEAGHRIKAAEAASIFPSSAGFRRLSASTIDVTDLSREAEALLIWSRVQRKLGNADSDRRPEGAMRRAPQEEYLVSHKHPNRRPHSSLR